MTRNIRHVILIFGLAIGLVIAGVAIAAPFDCPWTAVSGTNPSDGGPTGGGDYGGDSVSGP